MIYVAYTIHIAVSIFLILVVLLQQGKGADLSVFGGGSTQTAFGARSATTLLHKLTVTSFVLFICTTLVIGILQGRGGNTSIMSDVMGERLKETATGAGGTTPAEADPGALGTEPLGTDTEEDGEQP